MPLKGFDRFREKLPFYAGARIAVLPVYVLLMLAASLALLSIAYRFPGALAGLAPLVAFMFVEAVGFLLASQMWFRRKSLKARYGARAYQRALPLGLGGVACIFSLAISLYLPPLLDLSRPWTRSALAVMVTPLDAAVHAGSAAIVVARAAIGGFLLLTGAAMAARSLTTFGFDYMTVVYLYFPEESRIQESAIYSALRNPMYAAVITIALGGAVMSCTLYALLLFLLFVGGFTLFVRFVEEPELVERFGPSFERYRQRTPMFFVGPRNLGVLAAFILGRRR
jgi:protein-S-isoprenylcysteine O-methyltransferase Ste14